MKITTEFYGRLKDEFSHVPIEIELANDTTTIESIYLQLCKNHQVTANLPIVNPILNDTFADWQDTVKENDVVGFFPPAAGG